MSDKCITINTDNQTIKMHSKWHVSMCEGVKHQKHAQTGVLLVFGDGGNTRHVKHARLDVFYASGGERSVPNMKYMPILVCILCLVRGIDAGCWKHLIFNYNVE